MDEHRVEHSGLGLGDLPLELLVYISNYLQYSDVFHLVMAFRFSREVNGNFEFHQDYNYLKHDSSLRRDNFGGYFSYDRVYSLDLRKTGMTGIPYYVNNLRRLNISDTNIIDVPKFDKLVILDITNTRVKDVAKFCNLRELRASRSHITLLPESDKSESSLVYLDCSETNVTMLPKRMIDIEYLSATNTDLMELPEGMVNLRELYIAGTLVKTLPNSCSKLEILDCKFTDIEKVPESYVNLRVLLSTATNISEIPFGMVMLECLDISGTDVCILPNTLVNLSLLNCCSTGIMEIPSTFTNLTTLCCHTTKVERLPNLPLLENLNCNLYV